MVAPPFLKELLLLVVRSPPPASPSSEIVCGEIVPPPSLLKNVYRQPSILTVSEYFYFLVKIERQAIHFNVQTSNMYLNYACSYYQLR